MEEKINKFKSMTNEQLEDIIYIHRNFHSARLFSKSILKIKK